MSLHYPIKAKKLNGGTHNAEQDAVFGMIVRHAEDWSTASPDITNSNNRLYN